MTRRLIAVEIDGTIMTLRGWKAHGLALGAGLRPIYNGVQQGWMADTKRLSDFLAYLAYRNIPVEVTDVADEMVTAVTSSEAEEELRNALHSSEQLDLFGGGA